MADHPRSSAPASASDTGARQTSRPGSGPACVVLAAGKGSHMKSSLPKVLHRIAGRPMLHHVLAVCEAIGASRIVTVVGHGGEAVAASARAFSERCSIAVQEPQLGTGHAVQAANAALQGESAEAQDDVFILYGDSPLIEASTLERMAEARRSGASVVVLGFTPPEPGGYGRLILDSEGRLDAIVEAKDASPEEAAVRLCNSGVMAVDGSILFDLLDKVDNANAKGEYYLTDIVAKARQRGLSCAVVEGDPDEVLGVNARTELAMAERVYQDRRRLAAMEEGVTLRDPASVQFCWDTVLEADAEIEPHVVFGPSVHVGAGALIRAFSVLEHCFIPAGAQVGPLTHIDKDGSHEMLSGAA